MAKRKYNTWTEEDMHKALEKHRNGEIGFNEACRRFNIPKPTLRRHLKGLNIRKKIGRPNDITPDIENILAQHLINLESYFFGLTPTEFRKLAFEVAEYFQFPHRFNKEKKTAGKKWYYRFMKEHPDLSLRVPEPTSMARSKGFNKERINAFFDKYEEILDKYKFGAHQIYNMDETAISTVHKPSKVIAQKGKHQVGAITSGERGLNTTCVCAMNAAGEFIPPMLIYKRCRLNEALKTGAPPNTEFGCSKNGWITSELFVQWLQHFIKCTRLPKSDQKQILLLLDGHSTHKNLEGIMIARDYGIVMLSFPAHTTHRLQPLDRAFFKSLKSCYNEAASSWLRSNPGSVIKQANVAELLGKAYPRSVRMKIALSGYKATGLWPCDRTIIGEEDFVASVEIFGSSNREIDDLIKPTTESCARVLSPSILTPPIVASILSDIESTPIVSSPPPITTSPSAPRDSTPPFTHPEPSTMFQDNDMFTDDKIIDYTHEVHSVLNILSPIPNINTAIKKMTKGTQPTMELTSTPYKKELEAKENKNKKPILNMSKIKTEPGINIGMKRRNTDDNSKKKKKCASKESWLCKLCGEDRKENMIQCTKCKDWVHDLCAGVESKVKQFVCDLCVLAQ